MLWPEKRDKDSLLGDKVPGTMDRTTQTSYLRVPGRLSARLPQAAAERRPSLVLPWIFGEGEVQIGPIPKGTPVDLLANLDILGEATDPAGKLEHQKKVFDLLLKMKHRPGYPCRRNATDDEAKQKFANLVPGLIELSKCPDYVVNRGHYFGTSQFQEEPGLSDDDKRALIEFLKTF